MLRCLSITNFQCHASKVIHFDPHCTTIIGPNGAGKSAILRSLEWLSFNSWDGKADGFITWGAGECEAKLWTDKHRITRHKGKSGNYYVLDGKRLSFDSVNRRSVPEAVQSALRLSKDNFQGQLEQAFWFSLSAPEVVRSLNRIVNLDAIDASLAMAASKLREARTREKLSQERVTEAKNITESLAWTAQAHSELAVLERQQTEIASIASRIAQAEGLLEAIAYANRVRDHALALVSEGRVVLDKAQKVVELQQRINRVQAVLDQIGKLEQRKTLLGKELERKKANLAKVPNVCPTCKRPL